MIAIKNECREMRNMVQVFRKVFEVIQIYIAEKSALSVSKFKELDNKAYFPKQNQNLRRISKFCPNEILAKCMSSSDLIIFPRF